MDLQMYVDVRLFLLTLISIICEQTKRENIWKITFILYLILHPQTERSYLTKTIEFLRQKTTSAKLHRNQTRSKFSMCALPMIIKIMTTRRIRWIANKCK